MSSRYSAFVEASQDRARVGGLTHNFYRYPGRFSPAFAREAIRYFTGPGELVLDPFVGGGTTLVEAGYLGRKSLGLDVSSLAAFVSKVKTTPLPPHAAERVSKWAERLDDFQRAPESSSVWSARGKDLRKNLGDVHTWRLRQMIGAVLHEIGRLQDHTTSDFLRCCLLRTAQWALDGREAIPRVADFRRQLKQNITEMLASLSEYSERIAANRARGLLWEDGSAAKVLNLPAATIERVEQIRGLTPSLVLTSPPYPGVHVLYHRWQVKGRRETAAAFWIANRADGNPTSTYTLDSRHSKDHARYFEELRAIFTALHDVVDRRTTIVQLVAFSDPLRQLPRYLKMMSQAGFRESFEDGGRSRRLWRPVPNRRWYASQRGQIGASREAVLVHRKE